MTAQWWAFVWVGPCVWHGSTAKDMRRYSYVVWPQVKPEDVL